MLLLKYQELTVLGDWFAKLLAEVVARLQSGAQILFCRERGYNQAELIARPLAERLGI